MRLHRSDLEALDKMLQEAYPNPVVRDIARRFRERYEAEHPERRDVWGRSPAEGRRRYQRRS